MSTASQIAVELAHSQSVELAKKRNEVTDNEPARADANGVFDEHDESDAEDARRERRESGRYEQPNSDLLVSSRFQPLSRDLAVAGLLVFFSIWGVLIRLGLTAIWTFDGTPVQPLLWSQIVGTALMGLFVASKNSIENHYLPLYAGLTTGLCGSVTTFSTFVMQDFLAFSNSTALPRDRFRDFLDGLGQAILTIGMAMAALRFGLHVHTLFTRHEHVKPIIRMPSAFYNRIPRHDDLYLLSAMLGLAFWVGSIVLCALKPEWRGQVTFALVFGPVGALGRYYLSKLNPRVASFPLGTFAANMLATALLATFFVIQRTASRGAVACGVLQGLGDGLCGCLSTISTFAVEIRALARRNAYRYVAVSWVVGQLLVLLIYGVPAFILELQPRCSY